MAVKTKDVAVGFCLDESGSMGSCKQATIDGFNQYVKELRKQDGKTFVTLTTFSERGSEMFREKYAVKPVGDVPKLTDQSYQPGGNTPLLDAIGHTIRRMDDFLKLDRVDGEQPTPIIVIQTDGYENASRDYTRDKIVKLIHKREKRGWLFVYLGADQDSIRAEQAATSMGMMAGSTMTYDSATSGEAFAATASSVDYARGMRATGQHVNSSDVSRTSRAVYSNLTGTADPAISPGPGWIWDAGKGAWILPGIKP